MTIADPRATKYETAMIRITGRGLFVQAPMRNATPGSAPVEVELVEGTHITAAQSRAVVTFLTNLEADGGPIDAAYAPMAADPSQLTALVARAQAAQEQLDAATAKLADMGIAVDEPPAPVMAARKPKPKAAAKPKKKSRR